MRENVENKQAAPAVNKKVGAKTGPGKVWRLMSPKGRAYVTANPAEAHHLINTKGYKEASK